MIKITIVIDDDGEVSVDSLCREPRIEIFRMTDAINDLNDFISDHMGAIESGRLPDSSKMGFSQYCDTLFIPVSLVRESGIANGVLSTHPAFVKKDGARINGRTQKAYFFNVKKLIDVYNDTKEQAT